MIQLLRRFQRDERGATLGVVAVFMAGTLGTMALAIDLGMLTHARLQAQNAADAAALAGASAYLDIIPAAAATSEAERRALEIALGNNIRGVTIDSAEVTVQPVPAEFKVYVHVRRDDIPTWFARLLGFATSDVSADATAQLSPASSGRCLRPFAVPDMWNDANEDTDGNRIWDSTERWTYNPADGDFYRKWQDNPTAVPTPTGYGSEWRNPAPDSYTNDFGRPFRMRAQDLRGAPTDAFFYPLRLRGSGRVDFKRNILECVTTEVHLHDDIPLETDDVGVSATEGLMLRYMDDPSAYWNASTNTIEGSAFTDPLQSPRVVFFALFDPNQISTVRAGQNTIQLNDFAYFFLDAMPAFGEPVRARFMYYASGAGVGSSTGTLVRVLQLVN